MHILKSIKNRRRIVGSDNTISIKRSNWLRDYRKLKLHGNHNSINVQSRIGDVRIIVYGNNNIISIAQNVVFKKGVLWIEGDNNSITIDCHTTIEEADIATAEGTSISIGCDCMLSTGIRIATSDAHSIIDPDSMTRLNPAKNIQIKNHVWIGMGSTINKGVTIEGNSVVAGKSVITHDIPVSTVVGGVPGQIIKQNVSWIRERI